MKRFNVYATVVGSKFIGTYEAESEEGALEKAYKDAHVSLCWQCSREVNDPDFDSFVAEEDK